MRFRISSRYAGANFALARVLSDLMGREGFEPSTLGLRVDATALARSREGSQRRLLSEIGFGWVLAV
jgi:hypothetical protein